MSADEDLRYHPEKKDNDPSDGLLCFINGTRVCGADCMAYSSPPQGKDYGGQWACCRVLVAVHQLAKHTTILAQLKSTQAIDAARAAQTPPPQPR